MKNQKLRAIAIVSGMLAIGVCTAVVLRLAVTYLSMQTVTYVAATVAFSGLFYIMYLIVLQQIRTEDKLEEFGKK
jgi:hypothetical protein